MVVVVGRRETGNEYQTGKRYPQVYTAPWNRSNERERERMKRNGGLEGNRGDRDK